MTTRPTNDGIVWVSPAMGLPQRAWGTAKRAFAFDGHRIDSELAHDIRSEDAVGWPPGSDYWPFKSVSDIALRARAFAPGGRPARRHRVQVRVGQASKRLEVFGDRTIEWTRTGRPRLGEPSEFLEMDLHYTRAYGGVDDRVPVPPPRSFWDLLRLRGDHPGVYPRNQSGKGYLVVDSPIDGVELPNLEDPDHLLTADNLIVKDPALWYRQPLPWFLDWHYPAMFPRGYYIGAKPWFPVPDSELLEEVRRGFVPEMWRDIAGDIGTGKPIPPVYYQEASLGMTFSDLREGTPIEVVGMHPERERMTFAIPRFPKMEIEVEGDRQQVEAKILHVVITPHEEKVEITWAGIREDMPRAFFPGIHGDIPITLWVDGHPIPFETPEPIYQKIKKAEAEGKLDVRPQRRRPGEPGYVEIMGALLPEDRPRRERDQTAHADAVGLGDVDPVAGRLLLKETDWELAGPVPFAFRRFYSSSMAWRAGALGLGWTHCLEQAVWEQDGWILCRMEDGREIGVPVPGGELGIGASVHHPNVGVTVLRVASDAFEVRTDEGRRYAFTKIAESVSVGAPKARLSRIWGPDGGALDVRYDTHGRLDRLMLPGGRHVRFEHDERGRLTRVFAPTRDGGDLVVAARYEIDVSGQLREAVDGRNRAATYRYQARLLTEQKLPNGLVRRFTYDGQGARARCVGERWGEDDKEREYLWSEDERVVGIVDARGSSFSARVTPTFQIDRVLDRFANETTRVYDETSGLLASQTTKSGETTYLYDAAYHLADVTAPDAGSVGLEHDALGRLVKETDADGHALKRSWDHLGRLSAAVDRVGASVIYDYDGEGPLRSLLLPGETRLAIERDPQSQAIASITSSAGTRYAARDALGRPVDVTDELGQITTVRYAPDGRVSDLMLPEGVRRTLESDTEGRVTRLHDGAEDVHLVRDDFGRLTQVAQGEVGARLHHDAEGRVKMVESEAFDFWELVRDAAGRVIEESGFSEEKRHALRDHDGKVRRAMRGASRTEVKRDRAARPVELEHGDGTFQRFAWTPGGKLSRAQDADRVLQLAHDGEGRLAEERAGQHVLTSTYDPRGARTALDSSLGLKVRVERDLHGRATQIIATQGDQTLELRFERDALGRETRRHLPGGLSLRWQRDGLGRPTERGVFFGDRALDAMDFAWRGESKLVRRAGATHHHDARGRLVQVGPLSRALDEVGRVFRDPAMSDLRYEGLRVVESYGTEYGYDGEGRRVSKKNAMGDETRYRWDGAGRLVSVWLSDDERIAYDYDGLGRRVARRREKRVEIEGLDEPVWEPVRETEYVWDGLSLLHEIEGGEVVSWIWEEGRLVGRISSSSTHAVLTDPAGIPTELTDAKGNVAWKGEIDVFGTASMDVENVACPWRFGGHYEDPDTRLQHSWLRVYDPEVGSYLTESPLGVAGGTDLYGTVNDPFGEASPLGLGRGYAAFCGELPSERLEAELLALAIGALDRGDGAAGPPERFESSAARVTLPDAEAIVWGHWERWRPGRQRPRPASRLTRLPETCGLTRR